jgi:hypothetical protein
MKAATKIDLPCADMAALTNQGIDGFGHRVVGQRQVLQFSTDGGAIEQPYCRGSYQHNGAGIDLYIDAVFFKQIVLLPFQFVGEQFDFFFPVRDQLI